jgi:hypothetical protein
MPTNLFPFSITNTTPLQLMETYRHHLAKRWTITVDEPKQEIRIELTPMEKAKQWVKGILPW